MFNYTLKIIIQTYVYLLVLSTYHTRDESCDVIVMSHTVKCSCWLMMTA